MHCLLRILGEAGQADGLHLLKWLGHFHPAMTVFPIAMLLSAALAELLYLNRRSAWLENAARYCVIIAGIGGLVTAPLGWFFAIGHRSTTLLEWHRWLGTVGAAYLLILLIVSESYRRKPGLAVLYRLMLFLAVPAVMAIGFLGGAMVYGIHEYDWNPPGHQHASDEGHAPATALATQSAGPLVKMTDDMTFDPASLTVDAGTTVTWRNVSTDVHTVTADAKKATDPKDVVLPAGVSPFDSGKVGPGATYTYTFTAPGEYHYVCLPHESMGMTGSVTVKSKP